jgi:hypothetical protein
MLGVRHQERKKDKGKDKVGNGPGQLLGFYAMNGCPSFLEKLVLFFRWGPLSPGSSFGHQPKRKPPRGMGLLSINLVS